MSNTAVFTDQVNQLVRELEHLRGKSHDDDQRIRIVEKQYDDLAASFEQMRSGYERRLHALTVERDRAIRGHAGMESLLNQAADLILQASRAAAGDETPEQIPDRSFADRQRPYVAAGKLAPPTI